MSDAPLDAATAALFARMGADFADASADPSVEERRDALRRMAELYGPDLVQGVSVEPRAIRGPDGLLPLRIYRPEGVSGRVPVLVHIHGGGWVLGDPESYERVCRAYAAAGRCIVVDVHYRRAPEHRFPAAVEDCGAALVWAARHARRLGGDPRRLMLTGDSAGGNLAAAVAQKHAALLALQVLVYPVLSASSRARFASRKALGDGRYFLREFDIHRAETEYLSDPRQGERPAASPLLAPEAALRRLPPTLIVTGGLDPLRDEGEAYASRLEAAGVPVALRCIEGAIHGFVLFAGALPSGEAAIGEIGAHLRMVQPRARRWL